MLADTVERFDQDSILRKVTYVLPKVTFCFLPDSRLVFPTKWIPFSRVEAIQSQPKCCKKSFLRIVIFKNDNLLACHQTSLVMLHGQEPYLHVYQVVQVFLQYPV